jgi:hypothetical protein
MPRIHEVDTIVSRATIATGIVVTQTSIDAGCNIALAAILCPAFAAGAFYRQRVQAIITGNSSQEAECAALPSTASNVFLPS